MISARCLPAEDFLMPSVPNSGALGTAARTNRSPLAMFDCFFPSWLWDNLAETVNAAHAKRESKNEALSYEVSVTGGDIRTAFVMRLLFALETRQNVEEHFVGDNPTSLRYTNLLGLNRFKYIMPRLSAGTTKASRRRLWSSFRTIFASFWNPGLIVAIDEVIFPYVGDHELLAHIPRKPHPTGFLCYLAVSRSTGPARRPYVLDFCPVDVKPKTYARMALTDIAKRMQNKACYMFRRPHIVADAAFGGEKKAMELSRRRIFCTLSCSSIGNANFLTTMGHGLEKGYFRLARRSVFSPPSVQSMLMFRDQSDILCLSTGFADMVPAAVGNEPHDAARGVADESSASASQGSGRTQ